jgi:D-alanine-D-alanine ligase
MTVKRIGLLLETVEDAPASGQTDPSAAYHWREPEEIAAIQSTLEGLGYMVTRLGSPESLARNPQAVDSVDFVLNLSVGFTTRFRTARGSMLLEILGKPYSGADPYARLLSQHKELTKALWDKVGLPTPTWCYIPDPPSLDPLKIPELPVFIKPAHEGSSVGIDGSSLCRSLQEVKRTVTEVWEKLRVPMIMERFIAGREIKVGIVGNHPPRFLGMIEDIHPDGSELGERFMGFGEKYHAGFLKRAVPAGDPLLTAITKDVQRIHRLFVPVDYATVDLRVDRAGRHWFLEYNADATLHPARTLAQCCLLNGTSYAGLLKTILDASFERWRL